MKYKVDVVSKTKQKKKKLGFYYLKSKYKANSIDPTHAFTISRHVDWKRSEIKLIATMQFGYSAFH